MRKLEGLVIQVCKIMKMMDEVNAENVIQQILQYQMSDTVKLVSRLSS